MSVMEKDKIDGVGIDEKTNTLVFLVVDHLPWIIEEYSHLKTLQAKLNTYIAYIETKQYKSVYRNKEFDRFRIEIAFKYQFTENCEKFLGAARAELKSHNIDIKYSVVQND
ncbi:MAG: DUF6572 domain-containing protein [Acutalibacteraceae bacterium]